MAARPPRFSSPDNGYSKSSAEHCETRLESLERASKAVPMQVNPATASLYIVHPLRSGGMSSLFSTHPPIAERVRRLRAMDAAQGIA